MHMDDQVCFDIIQLGDYLFQLIHGRYLQAFAAEHIDEPDIFPLVHFVVSVNIVHVLHWVIDLLIADIKWQAQAKK